MTHASSTPSKGRETAFIKYLSRLPFNEVISIFFALTSSLTNRLSKEPATIKRGPLTECRSSACLPVTLRKSSCKFFTAMIIPTSSFSSNNIGVALPSSINVKQSAAGCSKVIPLLSIAQVEPISPLTANNTINILLFRITIKSYLFSIILQSFPQKIHCKETNKKQKPHKITIANILAYVTSITFSFKKQVPYIKVTMNIHSSLT